jgi:hypothetical protein
MSTTKTKKGSYILGSLAGFLFASIVGVKMNFLVISPFILAYLYYILKSDAKYKYESIQSFIASAIIGYGLIFLFLYLNSGNSLIFLKAEMNFNNRMMGEKSKSAVLHLLKFYPKLAFGLSKIVYGKNVAFNPFGGFFIFSFAAFFIALFTKDKKIIYFALMFLFVTLVMQFWPQKMKPYYIPIHRLPRFMHIAAFPGAILTGAAFAWMIRKYAKLNYIFIVLLVLYGVVGSSNARVASYFHNETVGDMRVAAKSLSNSALPVHSDIDLKSFIDFYSKHKSNHVTRVISKKFMGSPGNSFVVLGGSRRPDLSSYFIESLSPDLIPESWVLINRINSKVRSWRLSPLSIYFVPEQNITSDKSKNSMLARSKISNLCPITKNKVWELIDTIDMGDMNSEKSHDYLIENQSWQGQRGFYLNPSKPTKDNGRAFLGKQSFTIKNLSGESKICLVKRIDNGVKNQISEWSIKNSKFKHIMKSNKAMGDYVSFIIPKKDISKKKTLKVSEKFVKSDFDINSFKVEIYQLGN